MSWYPETELLPHEVEYLQALQHIWRVKDASGEWVPYILEPHQIEWHRDDVSIQFENAPNRLVIKSRNTSFTSSCAISNLMAVPYFPEQTVPFTRLNVTRAKDLLSEIKDLIRHMTPIVLPNGQLYPFDPAKVNMDSSVEITFENRVVFRAFPATNAAAENIRGLRILGSAGIIDESNFMKDFTDIYIATRDATRGTIVAADGIAKEYFQMNIGTTLKGHSTKFKIWLDQIKKVKLSKLKIYYWPVFNPAVFDINLPPLGQEGLDPITKWHNIGKLNEKYLENKKTFLEEYMCHATDADSALYTMAKVMSCIMESVETNIAPEKLAEEELMFGIDPAGEGGDFFSIVGFDRNSKKQVYLEYTQRNDLDYMQQKCCHIIDTYNPVKVRVDGNGLGYQLSQYLKKQYGERIEIIRGSVGVRIDGKQTIPFKEFLHTNILTMMERKELKLFNDEMQIRHFTMWDTSYEAEHTTEYGHGDIVIAVGLALLPLRWKNGVTREPVQTMSLGGAVGNLQDSLKAAQTGAETFSRMGIMDKLEYWKKTKSLRKI